MTPANFTIARSLANKLMTTCQPSEHWEELDELTLDQCKVLDTIAFECQCCNHWFPVAEQHEKHAQWFCADCV